MLLTERSYSPKPLCSSMRHGVCVSLSFPPIRSCKGGQSMRAVNTILTDWAIYRRERPPRCLQDHRSSDLVYKRGARGPRVPPDDAVNSKILEFSGGAKSGRKCWPRGQADNPTHSLTQTHEMGGRLTRSVQPLQRNHF